ncbi:hypothetical protein GobsT_14270 [Gemmata obscuriglobus]|uniref:Uncharacterized protein n=1 Tax=Gemmata obscuriglobus TaxID=114 RepID=A0A2Z3H6Z3_9BACT|nr:hypothetical protein [Gemmata obscuriglobus]AWM40142.1 hypothetical protein C1280_26145 [Gemmata obscuriglobus]QEG26682.1 hypothetical protein GobsT_14270 [Gemmata obscuriglobus]VTS02335.1 unnamed protein product [Gemmata obscuriglobus UQM 2246]
MSDSRTQQDPGGSPAAVPFGPDDPLTELVRLAHHAAWRQHGMPDPADAVARLWDELGWPVPDSTPARTDSPAPDAPTVPDVLAGDTVDVPPGPPAEPVAPNGTGARPGMAWGPVLVLVALALLGAALLVAAFPP